MSKDYYNDVDKDIQIENIAKSISEDDKLATKAKLNNALRKNFHKKSILLGPILLVVLVGIIVQYIYTNYYVLPLKERSLFEPLNKLEIDRKLWGQYNPQSIFLLRTCHPNSLQFGISWYDNTAELRHYISDIESFQTLIGDGKSFGHHVVLDKFGNVTIHWVSIDEYWSARISVNRDPFHYGTTIGLILHLYSGEKTHSITVSDNLFNMFSGSNSLFGNYTLSVQNVVSVDPDISVMASNVEDSKDIPSTINNTIEKGKKKKIFKTTEKQGSLVAAQFVFQSDFKTEVAFFNGRGKILTANNFDELFEVKATAFKEKFENVFGLKEMGMPDIYQAMGMTALSNLLSSVSYYYGNLGAIGYYNSYFDLKNIELILLPTTRGSSRSSIDDHLFSLLTLSHFDIDIIKQIIRSWLGIMNKLGVLPTELQQETLDFRISQAPTIFYLINKLFTENVEDAYIEEIYIKLEIFARHSFEGLNSHKTESFSWKVFPPYMTDYPRYVNKKQYNVDLHCWMIIASRLMKRISAKYGTTEQQSYFEKWNQNVDIFAKLNDLFWDVKYKQYGDIHNIIISGMTEEYFVNESFGYNSLYPMMLKLLPVNSLQLNNILEKLEDSKLLWTPYGLRSLAQSSELYNMSNINSTYRGDVFIPYNYLILGSLKYYSEHSNKFQNLAHSLYYKLRNNLVVHVAREFKRTKMLWESYKDNTGEGKGRPLHNWSSLILLIMSEKF